MKLLNRLARLVGACLPPSSDEYRQREIRAAEERWRERNAAAKAAGCPCGAPATVVRVHHGTLGSVPYEAWTCAEHAGAASFATRAGTLIAYWARPQACAGCDTVRRCGGRSFLTTTGEVISHYCPLRPFEEGEAHAP